MDFIKDFRTQTNLLNEGNNCLKFTDYYRNNNKIIIPKVSRMSHSILIMSYEDGIKYTDNTISTYNRSKVFLLMKLFIIPYWLISIQSQLSLICKNELNKIV